MPGIEFKAVQVKAFRPVREFLKLVQNEFDACRFACPGFPENENVLRLLAFGNRLQGENKRVDFRVAVGKDNRHVLGIQHCFAAENLRFPAFPLKNIRHAEKILLKTDKNASEKTSF